MNVAYLSHPDCLRHDMGAGHPECAARVAAIADRLLASGLLDLMRTVDVPLASREQIVQAHSEMHWARLVEASPLEGFTQLDPDTAMNPFSLTAALRAAGAAVRATEGVVTGEFQRAFCNVRPPGHHAERDAAMGFCLFNNVAIGMRHALDGMGVQRVALVDFDVHHGNGSEDILANDDRVLMVSTFESNLYPYSGQTPRGRNMCNVGLPAYSTGDALREAVQARWTQAMEAFKPELIFVSAGFDAHREDEMSHLGWREADYAWVSAWIVEMAERYAQGRIVSVLEGGYSLPALARCAELHVRALLDLA
jgi:acetoin utilization deacetylase AcuC-like enzyme